MPERDPVKVSLVGPGHVGATLLHFLAEDPRVEQVFVMARRPESAAAAIMDVAGASPLGARKLSATPLSRLSDSDLIILTCGPSLSEAATHESSFAQNLDVLKSVLDGASLKRDAIIIVVSSPVDDLTPLVQALSQLPPAQVIGFGGDLDVNRLVYALLNRRSGAGGIMVVGEHGANAIPVFDPSHDYQEIAQEIRQFIGVIKKAGPLRNLAAGVLLGKLVDTILGDTGAMHSVCGYMAGHDVFLTWPHSIGRTGLLKPVEITLTGPAKSDFSDLLAARKAGLRGFRLGGQALNRATRK